MKYVPTIGLEIHMELKTKTKMFCACLNDSEEREPNKNVCPVCLAHPGALPVANLGAIRAVLKIGMALNGNIAEISKFDRKNYFYPDLPKAYQISQYDQPFVAGGYLEIDLPLESENEIPKKKKIRITRVHLEEDTGRLVHPDDGKSTLVDFNRAGVPLAELVTEPDIASGYEAQRFAEELRSILRYLGVANADMEKGELRCEVNISMAEEGADKYGTKVEIKNLNSFRSVGQSIDYEIKRQIEVLEEGGKIIQETRGWDEVKGETFSQRKKEEAHDYRYFPEPDLLPMAPKEMFNLEEINLELPELPEAKRLRFMKEYGLKFKEVEILSYEPETADYFEKIVSELDTFEKAEGQHREKRIKLAYNYFINDLPSLLAKSLSIRISEKIKKGELKITPENFAHLIDFIDKNMISSAAAKIVLAEMFNTGVDAEDIVKEKNLLQVSDTKDLEAFVQKAIEENSVAVEEFKGGKDNALQFLVGKCMALSKGKANPKVIQELLRKNLSK
jgi:aspartyl-tRNA(Asn)/glutamyl-tRNA(Gln) amidotransferase subunit B